MNAALEHDLANLTRRERACFNALHERGWVDAAELRRALFGDWCVQHAVPMLIRRTRDHLSGTAWRLETAAGGGAYRLVRLEEGQAA